MRIKGVVLAVCIMLAGAGAAFAQTLGEAERQLDSGDYSKAEATLKRIITGEPNNARAHQLLGDVYKRQGRLDEAVSEYNKTLKLGGENAEVHKSLGTVYKWKKDYRAASASYKRALELKPSDREAQDDLKALEESRGLRLRFMAGGWEPDYTQSAYELMLSYGGFDRLDLNAGYSYSDQVYYSRDKFYASAYYFYAPRSYVKAYVAHKDYDYPVNPAVQKPNPDSNSYDTVPVLEFEVAHWVNDRVRLTGIYEHFRPTFFHDPDSTASNHKLTAEVYWITPLDYLRLKGMVAVLRDPDPDKTEIKGRDNLNTPLGVAPTTEVVYQTQTLIGAGAEYERGRWDADLKYLPNRDLDSSYSYSVLAGVGYRFTDEVRGRLDYVYDKYSSKSNYSGQTAKVYLASVFYALNPAVDLGFGLKRIDLPSGDDSTGFVTISYKTGIGF